MPSLSESEPPGCLSWIAAYCLGSYLMIPILVSQPATLVWPPLLVLAPTIVPFVVSLGFTFITGHGGALGALGIMSCVLLAWSGLVIASLGLIRCFTDGVWKWWPAALIVTIYTLAAIRVWLGL